MYMPGGEADDLHTLEADMAGVTMGALPVSG